MNIGPFNIKVWHITLTVDIIHFDRNGASLGSIKITW